MLSEIIHAQQFIGARMTRAGEKLGFRMNGDYAHAAAAEAAEWFARSAKDVAAILAWPEDPTLDAIPIDGNDIVEWAVSAGRSE